MFFLQAKSVRLLQVKTSAEFHQVNLVTISLFRVNDGAKVDDIHCEQVLIPTTFGPLSTSMPRPTKPTPTENINKEGSQKGSK